MLSVAADAVHDWFCCSLFSIIIVHNRYSTIRKIISNIYLISSTFFQIDEIASLFPQIYTHAVGDGLEAVGNAMKELVHITEVIMLVVLEHMIDAGVLHLDNGFHVRRDEFVLEHLDDARLCGFVEIVVGTLGLLTNSLVHFADVHRCAVLCQEDLRLDSVEVRRLMKERLLEVFRVDLLNV